MRLGLLTQWYDPETGPAALPGGLARGLQERGHEVQVLTGFPNYPTGVVAAGYRLSRRLDEQLDGVSVRRVALYPSHDGSFIRRAANYVSFGVSAATSGIESIADLDALWVNYSPAVALPMWAARYLHGVPCVIHALDLWPDTLHASGFDRGGRLFSSVEQGLHLWCRGMYRAADTVAYISPSVGEVLAQRGVPRDKLAYVPMWADETTYRPTIQNLRSELEIPEDVVVLLYAGALGEAQGVDTLIEACARVRDQRFLALIVGSGVRESSLRDRAEELRLENVRFLGRMPQRQINLVHATGDINYISLRPHDFSQISMPSKTQTSLAVGRALLVAAEGDVARVVTESRTGFATDPRDPEDIARAIRQICRLGRRELHATGARARSYYEETFSLDSAVHRLEALLEKATKSNRRSSRAEKATTTQGNH